MTQHECCFSVLTNFHLTGLFNRVPNHFHIAAEDLRVPLSWFALTKMRVDAGVRVLHQFCGCLLVDGAETHEFLSLFRLAVRKVKLNQKKIGGCLFFITLTHKLLDQDMRATEPGPGK